MTSEALDQFRSDYREAEIAPGYSGPRHFATTAVSCIILITASILALDGPSALELAVVPATFLYSNFVEWLAHRGPMHKPVKPIRIIYQRHTLQHHKFFTQDNMLFESTRDFHAVLFPPIMLVFFIVAFSLPAGLLLAWLTTANVALLFVATSLAYFLNYELLHTAYHMDPESWAGRLPIMAALRGHHTTHHDPALMNRYNFNITYPICDWLFGTWYRPGKG